MKKRVLAILMCVMVLGALTACGGNNKVEEEAFYEEEISRQPGETSPLGLEGDYKDTKGSGITLNVSYDSTRGLYGMVMEKSGEDDYSNLWMMTAVHNGKGKLEYEDAISLKAFTGQKNPDEDSKVTDEINYQDGEGYFTVEDGKLLWDGAAEEEYQGCVFEK